MAKEEKEEKGIEMGEGEASARSGTQKAKRRRSLRGPERYSEREKRGANALVEDERRRE